MQKVVAQVTRQFSTNRNYEAEDEEDMTEVDIGDDDVPPKDIAAGLVRDSTDMIKTATTGEKKEVLPTNIFTSPSFQVSDKLQAKIWAHEFIDFGQLLSNPVLEGKFQLTIGSGKDSTQALSLNQ